MTNFYMGNHCTSGMIQLSDVVSLRYCKKFNADICSIHAYHSMITS